MRCSACGAELGQDRFCRSCGTPHTQLPPEFAAAQARFAEVQARYRAGQLSDEAYEQALRAIVVQHASGYWMLGAESGAWYWYDGQRWAPRDPPAHDGGAAPPAVAPIVSTPAQAIPTQARERTPRPRWLLWLLIVAPLLCIALGAVLLFTTSYGAAVRYSIAIVFDPEDVAHYIARAAAYGDLEAHERAAADYTRAIEFAPDSTYLYTMRSFQYRALGHTDDAIADLGIVVLLAPDDCLAYKMRGDLWRQKGDDPRARADYERVLASGDGCYAREDASQALAQMGAPAATATPEAPFATATPETAAAATPTLSPQPTPTTQDRQMLFHETFDVGRDPVQGDVGEVRWEGGELQILVSQAGKDIQALFKEALAADVRMHVTARPVTLHPGSVYGVVVRTDPEGASPGGYAFHVRGDGVCRACIEQGDGSLTCPSDWQPCPAKPADGNWVVIEAVGPQLTFKINEALVATFEDGTYASGAVALWVANDEETTDTMVAFDDLALFEP